MTLFAGIDIGTSGARCLVTDERGRRAGYGERPWEYTAEGPAIRELDASVALAALEGACRDALEARAEPVAAVGVTSQRTGVVLIDAEGNELSVGPNADGRAAAEGVAQERAHGEEIYRIAGRLPAMLYAPARLAWFRANRPEVYERARWVLSFADWIVYRLTGEGRTEPTQAAEMLCYDLAAGRWSEELVRALMVPADRLPPIGAPGRPAGSVRPEAAARYGFAEGTPVVPAGADTQCAALALGAVDPGQAIVVAGTTMLCQHVRADASVDPEGWLWTSPHAVPGRFAHEAHCGEAGAAVAWLARALGTTPEEVAARADDAEPGAGGVTFVDALPSRARDFPLVRQGGFTFPVPLIALGRGAEDLARAVLEGIAFGARAGLDRLEGTDGRPDDLAVAGGVARSAAFLAALAGASDRAIRVATEPASSALGAAIAAASQHHGDVDAAVRAMADRGREVAPDPSHGYPGRYAAWRERAAATEEAALRVSHLIER